MSWTSSCRRWCCSTAQAPGEQVAFPLTWSGLTSEPTCTAARVPVAPGSYVVRARLDTKTSPDAPLQIT